MCGITGLYSFEPRFDRAAVIDDINVMNGALEHRGANDSGVWLDNDLPIAFGHRRLSILDLSSAGHQPMESSSGRYVITYNGEIYNFKELRQELGHDFQGNSDTEVLLAAIERWGFRKTLDKIIGMFAFALWDRKHKSLYFARDHMGKKPLYIGWAGSTLVFASELKAIHAHQNFNPDIDRDSLCSYMRFGYVPAPMCIYKQVWQLQAGAYMAIDISMLRAGQDLNPLMDSYWSHKDALMAARKNPITHDNIIGEFEGLLSACVNDRMISDVPLGAFLSGGIDSSIIVALMQKNSDKAVKTYTIGFEEASFNEAVHAKKVAAHIGTDHHELYLSASDALDIVPDLPQIYDEPFADISAIPTYLISKFARKSVTVALSGDGGDEMLGGYNRHISAPKAWDITNNHIPAPLRAPFANIIKSVPTSIWDKMRPNRPQFGSHMHKFAYIMGKQCEADVYMSLVSNWQSPKNLVRGGHEELIPLVDPDMQIKGLNFAEDMMYWDSLSYLNGDILTKVDRASMAVSLEVRAPLLDRRIYEYVWRLPLEYKIRDNKGKWLLRQVLKNHVPDELFNRPKQGFSVPVAEWLRGELREWAEDLLYEKTLRAQGLLDYVQVRDIWEQHQRGKGNHANKLWTILMFQAWHRKWVG